MVIQLGPVLTARLFQLLPERFFIHADAHGRKLKGSVQHVVPHQNVAVQLPVVIVGGTAVMGLAALQLVADAHDEHRLIESTNSVFPLLGGQVGPGVLQLLRGDEENIVGQGEIHTGELIAGGAGGLLESTVDLLDGLDQIFLGALFLGDDLFPVPLVHIDRVQVVQLLVPADGIHIGIQTATGLKAVFTQRPALPLCQRLDDLDFVFGHIQQVKLHRALHAGQVVVKTALQGDEQRGRDPFQVQSHGQIPLEIILDHLNSFLGLTHAQPGGIALGQDQLVGCHDISTPLSNKIPSLRGVGKTYDLF